MNKSEFDQEFEKAQGSLSQNNTAMNLLLHVVVPLGIALLGVFTKDFWNFNKLLPIALWAFIFIVYLCVWLKVHPSYEDVFSILAKLKNSEKENLEKERKISLLGAIANDFYIKNISAFVLRAMSVEFINQFKEKGAKTNICDEMLSDILSPFYLQGDVIFGFEISEKWSISVYFHDKNDKLLKPVWRRKSPTHPSAGLGRIWREGEGHVGKAFLDRRPILTGNANEESVAQLCRARGTKQTEYDNSTYISFASVPISMSADDEEDPYGVLVVSSDAIDRLSEESSTELLMHAAQTIALILELSNVNIDCFVNPNQDMKDVTNIGIGTETGGNGNG